MEGIEGVTLTPLRIIRDERGAVMHMLRADSPLFKQFGEIYFSQITPGTIKGWKLHTASWSNIAVVIGKVRWVLYDPREGSATEGVRQEIVLSPDNYQLLTTPPGIVYYFQNIGTEVAYVANCSTLPHDPAEGKILPLDTYPL